VPEQQFEFGFDDIGNRVSYHGDLLDGPRMYESNSLNQYAAA
jgi:hypothetical protein